MPRKARIDAPGALHHVIIRGIERKPIFKSKLDRDDFLDRIETILTETRTPCFAWALMTNHAHFLIRSGETPLSTVMRRLLTGYAVGFNRRHHRHGQLFQNRYKSILCQEDHYLLELTRYIHLNPLRAGIVSDLKALDKYPYTGHSVLMGNHQADWQDSGYLLGIFGTQTKNSRRRYREFVEKGITAGRRPELVGGGLIRSAGGWKMAKMMSKGQGRLKGDERILGDSDFVQNVLAECDETYDRKYRLRAKGIDVDKLAKIVADMFELEPTQLLSSVGYRKVVQARSIFCYWAVRELGVTATALANRSGLTQPAISISVKRGERIAREKRLELSSILTDL
jgi:REP element-mobilizing transposase RayT